MVKQFSWEKIYKFLDDKGLSESSQKTTINQMRRILKGMYGDEPITMAELKRSPNKAVEYINDSDMNYTIKKNHMTAMFKLYQALNIPTKSFEEKFKEIDDPEVRLMTAIYSGVMPPLRGNEWRGTKVITTKKYVKSSLPDNYILLPAKKMVVGQSKTSKHHEIKEIDLPQIVVDEIKKYITATKNDKLFDGMSASVFTKRLMKHLGYSVQTLRKRYVSEQVSKGVSPEERVQMARIMGHTIATNALDYSKPQNVKGDTDEEN